MDMTGMIFKKKEQNFTLPFSVIIAYDALLGCNGDWNEFCLRYEGLPKICIHLTEGESYMEVTMILLGRLVQLSLELIMDTKQCQKFITMI